MRTITNEEYQTLNIDFGEFHEVAELHSCGYLIEVERYDDTIIVKTTVGQVPSDDCHIYDRVRSLNWLQSEKYASAQERKIVWSQQYEPTEIVEYPISELAKALVYATDKVATLAYSRVH